MAIKQRLVDVRVYFKNPLGKKSTAMRMTESRIAWYRRNKIASPYMKIVRERGKRNKDA